MASGQTARPPGATVLVGELGAALAVVGAFMPWGAGDCYSRDHGTAMLPLVLLGAGLLVVAYIKGAEAMPFRLAALGALLCGVFVAIFVAYDIADVSRLPTPSCIVDYLAGVSPEGSPVFGLYVTLAGGVLLALGGLSTALAKPRARAVLALLSRGASAPRWASLLGSGPGRGRSG